MKSPAELEMERMVHNHAMDTDLFVLTTVNRVQVANDDGLTLLRRYVPSGVDAVQAAQIFQENKYRVRLVKWPDSDRKELILDWSR